MKNDLPVLSKNFFMKNENYKLYILIKKYNKINLNLRNLFT